MRPTALARLWRTLRPLRGRQLVALARHRLSRGVRPRPWPGPPPELRMERARAPFLGAPEHAGYEPGERIRLLNRTLDVRSGIDWDVTRLGPLWSYHLHQFEYLRASELPPDARAELILDWIARHPRGVGWDPHPTSLRIFTWIKLLLTPGALALDAAARDQVLASLGAQLRTLEAHLETHLLANHYLANLLALVLGGVALASEDADRWLAHERALRAELDEQILPDGAHVERSPMYHASLLELLLDLWNAVQAASGRAPAALEAALPGAIARMLGALRLFTHPDGRIALFGDSAFGVAQEPEVLERYAASLGVTPRDPEPPGVLRHAGFVRLAAGPFSLLVSVGPIRPAYQPGHAHADALAFELCFGGTRVVTDAGVGDYRPGPWRDESRATRSHATIEVRGRDQAELWAAHRVGGRPRVALTALVPARAVEAWCSGWATPRTRHRRRIEVRSDGVEILDRIEGRPEPVHLVLPLAPGLEPHLSGGRVELALASGGRLELVLPEGPTWRIERSPYFPEFGRRLERPALVGRSDRFAAGRWVLREASASPLPPSR